MPEDPARLKLWRALEKGTDQQRAMVGNLVKYAASLLDRVVETFPTYTLHNAEHARNVAENVANLLGDRVGDLTPVEGALLVLAAYFHDIGMVFSEEERGDLLVEPEWTDFLERNPEAFLEVAKAPKGSPPQGIAEWYCRWRHADRVYVHLRRVLQNSPEMLKWGVVSLYEALGELCRSHDKSVGELQTNPELTTDGIDGADVRFCAILLRLADILDFDGSRSPEPVYRYLGLGQRNTPRKERSDVEWLKHLSSGGIGFPLKRGQRYKLRFSAGPDHPAVEHDVRQFLAEIERELELCAVMLPSCSDRWRGLDLPATVDRDNIRPNGYRYGEYRFTLDQDHVLQLMMGEELYDSPYVFVREILQNAIDATRLRTHLEHAHGNLKFEPEPIRVVEWTDEDHYRWVRFDDNGTGMDEYIIRNHLLRVGSSYYTSALFQADLLRHGGVGNFVPISQFGIGLLSCFIVCDRIEISTLRLAAPGERTTPIQLSLDGLQGFFILRTPPLPPGDEQKYRTSPGTSISCRLDPAREQSAWDLKQILNQFLLASPVQVELDGENISNHAAMAIEFTEPIRVLPLENQTAVELSEKIRQPFHPSTITLSIKTINLTDFSPLSDLGGSIVWARLLLNDDLGGLLGEDFDEHAILVSVKTGEGRYTPADYSNAFSFNVRIRLNDFAVGKLPRRPEHIEWFDFVTTLPSRSMEEISRTADIRLSLGNITAAQNIFRSQDTDFLLSHNGIRVPVNTHPAFPMPEGAAWCALTLSDRLRPRLAMSRDRVLDFPWEIHSAVALTLWRALAKEGLGYNKLFDINPLFEDNREVLLGQLLADPLLRGANWPSEPLLRLEGQGQPVTLADALDRVRVGLPAVYVADWKPSEFKTPPVLAAAALVCSSLDVAVLNSGDQEKILRLRVKGPRLGPIPPGELLFEPLTVLPFDQPHFLRAHFPCLNSSHPVGSWLVNHAPELKKRFPGIFGAISNQLFASARIFDPDEAIAAVNQLFDRLGKLAPELCPKKSIYPTRSDFPAPS